MISARAIQRLNQLNEQGSSAIAVQLLADPSVRDALTSLVYRAGLDSGLGLDASRELAMAFAKAAERGPSTDRGATAIGALRTILQTFTGMIV